MLSALTYYSRFRFITNLLPLIQKAPSLRRVVTVAGGGIEGHLDTTDFPALRIPLWKIRGHLTSLITLGLEVIAKSASEVSFIHDYPGTVRTPLINQATGLHGVLVRAYVNLLGRWICVPLDESAARHLFFITSGRFPPAKLDGENALGVVIGDEKVMSRGSNGEIGSGVYSISWNGESAGPAALKILATHRDGGALDQIRQHTESEFKRIIDHD